MGRMSEILRCGMLFGAVQINDLNFADDAVIFADKTLLSEVLEFLNEEVEA